MGTVVFPEAPYKVFLTASAAERARRRYKQLKDKGVSVNLDSLLHEIAARDERDAGRAVAPLKPAEDAVIVDSTGTAITEVIERVLAIPPKRFDKRIVTFLTATEVDALTAGGLFDRGKKFVDVRAHAAQLARRLADVDVHAARFLGAERGEGAGVDAEHGDAEAHVRTRMRKRSCGFGPKA